MTKSEARKARKAGTLAGLQYWPVRLERTTAEEARHERAMERWARRYDQLNGAPESDEDR